jgi:pimeloyl-ACP methyl ester carboxylesterase
MEILIDQKKVFAATGGVPFDNTKPTVVFLHGSGMDHRGWALQTRWFAFHGFSVIAPDLPGHSLSSGEPLTTIAEMGEWLVKVLDEMGVHSVHLVGHSQGFLVALEAAELLGRRLKSLTAIATASAVPVNPALIETAKESAAKASGMMLQWGFGQRAQMGLSAVPGLQPIAVGYHIMSANPLATDLEACNAYTSGVEKARSISCPAQVILAEEDKMTPVKSGVALAGELGVTATVIKNAGHMLPIEAPDECLSALRDFILSVR